jgi:NACalpha-BTF3-like transcription factor
MSDKRYEDIEKIIEKANVTFAEAKEAYEKNGEDLLDTLIYLEKKSKLKKEPKGSKEKNKEDLTKAKGFFKRLLSKLLKRSFIVYNDHKTFINMPLIFVLLIFLFALPQSLFLLFLVILTGCRFKVSNDNNPLNPLYKDFEKNIKNGVSDMKKAFEDTVKRGEETKKDSVEDKEKEFTANDDNEDDFDEIIID